MKWHVEVWYKPGVTDATGQSVKKGIEDLGIKTVTSVRSGQVYILDGRASKNDVRDICGKLLANGVIQNFIIKAG